jgi:hypothetical protein
MHQVKERIRILNGYRVIYKPEYPKAMKNANWLGFVYEHVYVVENFLDRSLQDNEVVHHLDLDRANNRIENLLVLGRGQHAKLHAWLDKGAPMVKVVGGERVASGESKATKVCVVCNMTLQLKQKTYCSTDCQKVGYRKVVRPSKEELKELIDTTSFAAIGRRYSVSDNAVRKWARACGLL